MVFLVWLLRDEQLHQRGHDVENAERLAQLHQNKPGRKAKKHFPEAVLKLKMGSKG